MSEGQRQWRRMEAGRAAETFRGRLRVTALRVSALVPLYSTSSATPSLPLALCSTMAVRIRMAMHGVRNNRIFHIVAVNQRQRRNVKPIELLGIYNPRLNPGESTKTIEWSVQRLQYWLNVGATPSKTVTKLLQMVRLLGCFLRYARLLTTRAGRCHQTSLC